MTIKIEINRSFKDRTCLSKSVSKQNGMTLLELLVVIVIIGVLASLSYPLYNSRTIKNNRVVAITSLLKARSFLEQCYLNHAIYEGCSVAETDNNSLFDITLIRTVDSYLLKATNKNAEIDGACISFEINNTGRRTVGTGSTSTVEQCWSL
jgi:type IV pilus assembly protein PilE